MTDTETTLKKNSDLPERCPACGAAPSDDTLMHRHFACGAAWSKMIDAWYGGCKRALVLVPDLLAVLTQIVDYHTLFSIDYAKKYANDLKADSDALMHRASDIIARVQGGVE